MNPVTPVPVIVKFSKCELKRVRQSGDFLGAHSSMLAAKAVIPLTR